MNERSTFQDAQDTIQQAIQLIDHLRQENESLRKACFESLLFLTAPIGSPRLSPINRGNLSRLLEKVLIKTADLSEDTPQ